MTPTKNYRIVLWHPGALRWLRTLALLADAQDEAFLLTRICDMEGFKPSQLTIGLKAHLGLKHVFCSLWLTWHWSIWGFKNHAATCLSRGAFFRWRAPTQSTCLTLWVKSPSSSSFGESLWSWADRARWPQPSRNELWPGLLVLLQTLFNQVRFQKI